MSIDLNVLRKDLEAHKAYLNKNIENGRLGTNIPLHHENAYVKKVEEYKKDIAQLEVFLDVSNSKLLQEALNEASKVTNVKLEADKFIQNALSNPKLIKKITDISSKLKEHKIYLDKINPPSDK